MYARLEKSDVKDERKQYRQDFVLKSPLGFPEVGKLLSLSLPFSMWSDYGK